MSKVSGLFRILQRSKRQETEDWQAGISAERIRITGNPGKGKHYARRDRGPGVHYSYLDDFFLQKSKSAEHT